MENTIVDFLRGLIDLMQAKVLLGLIVANLCTGVFAAMLKGTFDSSKVKDFWKNALILFVSYIGVSFLAQIATDWNGIQVLIFAALIADMGNKIMFNLNAMGLPVPDHLPIVNEVMNAIGKAPKVLLKR